MSNQNPERRNAKRRCLGATATIRNSSQTRIGGIIVNISEHGCQIELDFGSVSLGQYVTIKLDGMEVWPGRAQWSRDTTVGIQFERALHSAIVDHLTRTRAVVELA
ncbi:PilZ domain-containing protein [Aquisediminimonas profunda]|uniref:PilZ domain-containing protein n=1 Tax=Aquisediminimonas profunda TaxID=1550733 RepID=UPI001C62E647